VPGSRYGGPYERDPIRDEAYRAIGRYTVAFSFLVEWMRRLIASRITEEASRERRVLNLTLGSLMARQLADPFFAMCRDATNLNENEQVIAKQLRGEVEKEIERRNRIVHGDWRIPQGVKIGEAAPANVLVVVRASRRENPYIVEELTVPQIDDICDVVENLWFAVKEFGEICTRQGEHYADRDPPARVEDYLGIEDGHVRWTIDIK
jgi:hypothetical protein